MTVKKVIPFMLSILMVGAMFAGCGSPSTSDNNNKTDTENSATKDETSSDAGVSGGNNSGNSNQDSTNTDSSNTDNSNNDSSNSGNGENGGNNGGNVDNSENTSNGNDGSSNDSSNGSDESVSTEPLKSKIYVVGDSTVCDYSSNLDNAYLPRYGYGTQLYNYFNLESDAQVVNLALSGRSSKNFLEESNYTTLKNSIGEGDYLIIGFGHNDEKSDDETRFTNPNKTYTDDSTDGGISFQYNLYENYIKLAVEKGATPILCTPIVRYSSSNNYTGSVVHNTSDGDYAEAIRTLGASTNTTVIDLTTITKTYYSADNDSAQYYHCHTTYTGEKPNEKPSGIDTTHLNKYGAKKVAYEFAQALKSTNCSLKNYVVSDAVAPTYENDFASAIREDYTKPNYTAFDATSYSANKLASLSTTTPTDWYKTAFGDIGGASKVSKFTFSSTDSKITVGTNSSNGKIMSSADGIGAVFIQIDSTKNFTASATVTITSCASAGNQSAFGMMLRDDIYMDSYLSNVSSNYVSAGALGNSSGYKALFKREESKLTTESNTVTVSEGDTYTVSISRVGQKITATFTSGTKTFTKEYLDVKLNSVDSNYMYLCLFANRNIIAEFSDISFEITGDAGNA
jgi:lysophospholipase L1-like esterase